VVGRVTGNGIRGTEPVPRIPYPVAILAALAGTAVIFAGGVAQLAILSGPGAALALGALPFIVKDLANVVVAGLLLSRFGPSTRALR